MKKQFGGLLLSIIVSMAGASVSQEWAKRYNGPGSATDKAAGIIVDSAGNVYVTGSSMSGGAGTEDFATLKYDPAGALLWERRYNGTGGSSDIAHAIALDASGSIYVTGGSVGSGANHDYLTVKYSPAGDTLWTRRYNGPKGAKDVAYGIAVDDSGYVYITGESEGGTGTHGIFEDYATVKYDSAGTFKWVARYNGPAGDYDRANSVAVDERGNVYVTGTSDGGSSGSGAPHFDYATAKYDLAGVLQWVRRYNGPGNGSDEGRMVKVDASGDVYVTGNSYGDGTLADFATLKYRATGDTAWISRFEGPGGGADRANALVLDGLGNTFVTGQSYGGSATLDDFLTIRYDSLGDTAWVRRYNGPASGTDGGTAIALDRSGSVLVTGSSSGTGTAFDYATIKYGLSGAEEWVIRYTNGDAAGSSDEPGGIWADTLDNVYVCGSSALDYATLKYSQTTLNVDQSPLNARPGSPWLKIFPNPLNKAAAIQFSLAHPEKVTLTIGTVTGETVAWLISGTIRAGAHQTEWDSGNLPCGIYLCRLQSGSSVVTQRLVLLR